MSDIALVASVDFSQAGKEVDAFVNTTKKKLSTIMAQATKAGGSLASRGGTSASDVLNSMDGAGTTAARRAYSTRARIDREYFEGNIRLRRATEREYTRFWKQELGERDRAEKAAVERSRQRMQASRKVVFGTGGSASMLDALFPSEAQIRDRSEKMRRQFERGMATGTVARQGGTYRSLIDSMFPTEAEIRNRSQQLRSQLEKGMATGTVSRQNGTYRSLIDSMFPTEAEIRSRSQQLRAQMEKGMATGTVRRQSGSYLGLIEQLTAGGTGRSNAIADFYNRQAEQAEKAAGRIEKASRRINDAANATSIRAIGNAQNTALGVSNRIGRQLGSDPNLQAELNSRLTGALEKYSSAIRTYGTRSTEAQRATVAWNRELQNIRGTIAEKGGLLRTLTNNANTLSNSIQGLGSRFNGFGRLLMNTQVVLSSVIAAFGAREIIQAITDFDRFSATLKNVSGSATEFGVNMRFLISEAERIGFSVGDVGNSFARLSVAMKNAGFSGNETRGVFTGLAEASRNFGLSSSDTMGIIRALEQSMSKGTFQAEEIRLQLGDRLPIAMAALTAAMTKVDGKAVDVNKRFEEGTIDVRRYAVEFVNQINLMSGGAATLASTSTSIAAAFGRLSTEFTLSSESLDKGGFGQAVISVTEQLKTFMQTLRESGGLEAIGAAVLAVANNFTTLAGAVAGAVAMFAAIRIPMALVGLVAALNPVTATIAAVTAGAALLGGSFASSATAAQRAASSITQAMRTTSQATEASTNKVAEATATLRNGVADVASSAESDFDKLVRSFQRMGNSLTESIRKALEATKTGLEAQLSLTEGRLDDAKRSLQEYLNAVTNLNRIEGAVRSQVGDANASAYGPPPAEYLQYVERLEQAVARIREGQDPIEAIGHSLRDLATQVSNSQQAALETGNPVAETFGGLHTTILTLISALQNLDTVKLNTLREQVQLLGGDLDRQRRGIESLGAALQNGGVSHDPESPLGAFAGNRTRTPNFSNAQTSRQESATRYLRNALRAAGALGPTTAAGATVLGADPSSDAMLKYLERVRSTLPGASVVLAEYNKKLSEGAGNAGRLSNALEELLQDIERNAAAAGEDTGAAQAYATAMNRVADAAKNARGEISNAAAAARAKAAVDLQLAKEQARWLRESERVIHSNSAIAAAYMESAQAGQRAEVEAQAYVEALKYVRAEVDDAGNAIGAYRAKIDELIPTLQRSGDVERNVAAARQMTADRDEIEQLELRQQLLSATADERERELAALRARQTLRGADPDVIAKAEASARRLADTQTVTEQMENSWAELSRAGEQAFSTIGDAITEAFAKGEISSVNFKNIAKAAMSEIVQAIMKLAILNPILNDLFGGTRATLSGALSAAQGSGTNNASAGGLSQWFSGNSPLGNLLDGSTNAPANGGNTSGSAGQIVTGNQNGSTTSYFDSAFQLLNNSSAAGEKTFSTGNSSGWMSTATSYIDSFGAWTGLFSSPVAATATKSAATAGTGMAKGAAGAATQSTAASAKGGLLSSGTMSSFLGGVGMGIGAGSMTSGMVSSMRGGATGPGGTIGTVAGSVIGGIFGPIGSLVGGAIGGAIGSMFGPTQKGMAQRSGGVVTYGVDENGQLVVEEARGKRWDEAASVAAVNEQLSGINKSAYALDLKFDNRFKRNIAFGPGNSGDSQVNQGMLVQALRSDDSEVQTAIDSLAGKGFNDLNEVFEYVSWVQETYQPMVADLSAFDQSIKDINKTFDEATEKAAGLGLSEERLNEVRNRLIREATEKAQLDIQTATTAVASRGLRAEGGIINNRNADLIDYDSSAAAERFNYRISLRDLGMSAEAIASELVKLEEVQQKERANIVKKYADEIDAWVSGTFNVLTFKTNAFEQSLKALDDQYDEAVDIAKELGYSEAELNAARQTSIEMLWEQRNANLNSALGGLASRKLRAAGTDEAAHAADLLDFDLAAAQERLSFRQQLRDFGLSTDEIAKQMLLLEETLGAERLAIVQKYNDAINEATKNAYDAARSEATSVVESISDYLRGLRTGDSSILDAQGKYELALKDFSTYSALAAKGDADAMSKLTEYGDILLQASRDFNGSGTTYVQDFNRVVDALEQVVDQGPDALTASFYQKTTETQTETLAGVITAVKDEITALRREVRQQSLTPNRVNS